MNEDNKEKLISIILSAFGLPSKDYGINTIDIDVISSIAIRQNILPIVVEGLKNLGYSDLLTDQMNKYDAKAIYDYTQRMVSLDEITQAFESASICYIPLKGSAIRDLYPNAWMRTSADIDVLIKKDDIEKAIHVLENQTSFSFTKLDNHEVHFVNKHVHLELHYYIETAVDRGGCSFSDPWDYVLTSEDSCACSFTQEYNIFYIVTHAAKHFIKNGGMGIRPVLDIYILKSNSTFDDDKVKTLCKNAGELGFYEMVCKLIDVWFYGDSHDEYSAIFEDIVFDGGVFGSQHLRIVSNKRHDSGKHYIGRRIFKTSKELKSYFPKCKKYPVLVPFFQVVRWIQLLKSKQPNAYVAEFKKADSIDQAEVEKYDKLLSAMGF